MESLQEALSKGNVEEARERFEQLLQEHPSSGLMWYAYAQFEYRLNNNAELEALFGGALKNVLDLRLWRLYLQHVRRVNMTVKSDESQVIIMKAYEFCLSNIGHDVYSGATWLEYVEFVKGLPMPEGDYDKQQRLDQLRKIYHRALQLPLDGMEHIWHSYDHFETTHNKVAAKKMLSDRSPIYMHCRSLVKELKDIVDGIDRDWIPVNSCQEDAEKWQDRMVSWMRWVDWERQNPAKLDKAIAHHRVLYAFRRALACCNYIPDLWMALLGYVELAQTASVATPADFAPTALLKQAISINSKSLILSFALTDRLDRPAANAEPDYEQCKAVFEALLSALSGDRPVDSGDAGAFTEQERSDITLAYLQYMQWTRRSPGGIAAARAVFARARKHPAIMYPLFTANALMEFRVRRDAAVAGKIFELGLGRFGSQPGYIADYLHYLIGLNDDQNARALFERAVNNLLVSNKEASYPIWCMYLEYELRYGELDSYRSLERRFKETFPAEDPLAMAHRQFTYDSLDVGLADYRQFPSHTVDPMTLATKIGRNRAVPFVVGEPLIDLMGRLPLPSKYDGPMLDPVLVLGTIAQVRITAPRHHLDHQSNQQQHHHNHHQPQQHRSREPNRRRSRSPDANRRRR